MASAELGGDSRQMFLEYIWLLVAVSMVRVCSEREPNFGQ